MEAEEKGVREESRAEMRQVLNTKRKNNSGENRREKCKKRGKRARNSLEVFLLRGS